MFCRLWAEAGSGGSGRPCPRLSSPAPTRVCPCRVVPVGFWPPSRAVSYRNSCSKAIAELSALGKFVLIPPYLSPRRPQSVQKKPARKRVCPCCFPSSGKGSGGWLAGPVLTREMTCVLVWAQRGAVSPAPRGGQLLGRHRTSGRPLPGSPARQLPAVCPHSRHPADPSAPCCLIPAGPTARGFHAFGHVFPSSLIKCLHMGT